MTLYYKINAKRPNKINKDTKSIPPNSVLIYEPDEDERNGRIITQSINIKANSLTIISLETILTSFKYVDTYDHSIIDDEQPKVYIIWGESVDNYIVGIYKDEESALAECTEGEKVSIARDGIIAEDFSRINPDEGIHCSLYYIYEGAHKLYFMEIQESGGGGAYHEVSWLYVSDDREELIEHAIDYFSEEHNRDDECEECECEEKLLKELRKERKGVSSAEIECTDNKTASVNIWSINI